MSRRSKGLHFYKKRKKISPSVLKEIFSWFFLFVLAILVAFVFSYSFGMKTSVIGSSMEPCLYNGQSVLINRFVYMASNPKRGDVVVFRPNGNENMHYYVKRIIGMPGEKITIQDGRILIDGYFYEADDSFDMIEDGGIATSGILLGEDEYFVLGDNRNNSEDSRSANIGTVMESSIVGKAWFHMAGGPDGMGLIK